MLEFIFDLCLFIWISGSAAPTQMQWQPNIIICVCIGLKSCQLNVYQVHWRGFCQGNTLLLNYIIYPTSIFLSSSDKNRYLHSSQHEIILYAYPMWQCIKSQLWFRVCTLCSNLLIHPSEYKDSLHFDPQFLSYTQLYFTLFYLPTIHDRAHVVSACTWYFLEWWLRVAN